MSFLPIMSKNRPTHYLQKIMEPKDLRLTLNFFHAQLTDLCDP